VVLHGGPGSGCSPVFRRFFDPQAYRIVLFDQRNCGRSTPAAAEPETDLAANTTAHLVADIERLREHLEVDRWLVFGGSWGCTLALAYAEAFPDRVTEMVLFAITTGRHEEWDWTFRGGLARFFPQQWEHLRAALPAAERDGDVVEAFDRLLSDPDDGVRGRATEAWCEWESATPAWPVKEGLAERFKDPLHAYAFARLVTHYARHYGWLEDGALLRGAAALAGTPAVLVNGRFDFMAPIGNAWALRSAWPGSELDVVEDAGHSPNAGIDSRLVGATDRFAGKP
jgi:proline iminopeptidase